MVYAKVVSTSFKQIKMEYLKLNWNGRSKIACGSSYSFNNEWRDHAIVAIANFMIL